MQQNKVKIISFSPVALHQDTTGTGYASLTWSIRMGYPRVTVYTDNDTAVRKGFNYDSLIIAPFNSVMVNVFLGNMKKAIDSKEPISNSIDCYNIKYVDGVKTNDVILQATATCGRDSDGVIYMSVTAKDRMEVKFKLLPNTKWHKMKDSSGNIITDKSALSNMYAIGYVARLKSLMDKYLADESTIKYTDSKGASLPTSSTSSSDI